jgi:tetraacyldisaccharide 4'-kinase
LVCGIARPERFATLVTHLGITTVATKLFEDHHHYISAELEAFGRSGIDAIVTTEKDAVKLKGLNLVNCPDIWYLTITLHIHGPRAEHEHFSAFLQRLTEKKEGWR